MTSGVAGTSGTSGAASGEVQSSTVPFATGESDRLPDFSASTCVWLFSWTKLWSWLSAEFRLDVRGGGEGGDGGGGGDVGNGGGTCSQTFEIEEFGLINF